MKLLKITLLLVAGALFFNSCKNYEEDIVGTWNFQTFDNTPQGTITWTFADDGTLTRVSTLSGGLKFDSCKYSIDKNLFKKHLIITDSKDMPGVTSVNGKFRIEVFKDDILKMTRFELEDGEKGGAYLRCELMRKQ
ncbi:MAG TPA: hypothetical protein PLG05_06660 [Bacteroidales bacterium]|mgnify:FL=1|nr:hypothetical protein [Bacteroidales bacterium]HOR60429.1 hypothetical protein [Bacteroidales bacterium]HPL04840.1 hypothetical protein [Bacteroidales bacterium]